MATQMAATVVGRTCPFCQAVMKPGEAFVECSQCHTIHHEECWGEHGGCTTPGCQGAPQSTRPQRQPCVHAARQPLNRRAIQISTDKTLRILGMSGSTNGTDWYLAGLASRGTSWLIIGIPLYFNVISNYLVFTTSGLIVATQTLWSGLKPKCVAAIPYEFISALEIKLSRWGTSKMRMRLVTGESQEIEIKNKQFAKAITELAGDYVSLTVEQ
jgi:hypothetical protein